MRFGSKILAGTGLLVAIAPAWHWQSMAADQPNPADNARALLKRGEYLVNEVARCGDCHTPRDAKGKLDLAHHLQGAPMWIRPAKKFGEWEDKAPDITASGKAGSWSEDKMVKFLSTGKKSDPPMPAYKLTEDDARAVTTYLRSLPGKGKRERRKDDD